jgi:glycine cleavage system protein P-like pyridoxal-binding family
VTLTHRAYIKMLGGNGLTEASKVAMLNANYMMARLKDHYRVKFTNENGRCAHEFIIDLAEFDQSAGLSVMDFAKRIQVSATQSKAWRVLMIRWSRIMDSILRLVRGPSTLLCS